MWKGVANTNMETMSELIQRAQAGDAEAYSALVGRFQDMAYGYAYAILSDFDLAQDAAQEAFVEAYQSLPALREALAFPAWFKRIVYKHCDRLTRRKRLPTVTLDAAAEVASPLPGPAEEVERRELARRVQGAIRELPVPQRVVTTLFYINGYSHQEISDFLEVPAKTVKSRLHSSRGRLRERMMDMVGDELKANALPAQFTQETVEQAVARARALRKEDHFDEAEQVLREVLAQVPEHPEALKILNSTLMIGRVYNQGRWDLLPELAEHGRTILKTTDDPHVVHQLAVTLLAMPAMPEAVAFLEEWIAGKGADRERLGMLAWAKGCVADYDAAEALWNDLLALAQGAAPEEILFRVPFVAHTLVDCFASAGQVPRAQHVARQGWEMCRDLGAPSAELAARLSHRHGFDCETGWVGVFHQAQLDVQDVARVVLARHQGSSDPREQAASLGLRSWVEDPQVILTDTLAWVRARIAAGEWEMLEYLRVGSGIRRGLWTHAGWRAYDGLAHAIWELLGQTGVPEAEKPRTQWGWEFDNPFGPIEAKDWPAAEELARRALERGAREGAWPAIEVATALGKPTPAELVMAVEEHGISSIDEYGMSGWYLVAREAAAAGDEAKAFDALRKALAYWSNPPYGHMELWENDARWGALREHPEFKRAFREKRRHIGPIYGQLHYFPGW